MATNWNRFDCPACSAENWLSAGDPADITAPDPEPGVVCHACHHIWIDAEYREYLEDNEVDREMLGIGPTEQYATLDDWLKSGHNRPALGLPTPHYPPTSGSRTLVFTYTNHKSETATRHVVPQQWYWGRTEYHPEDQWLLRGLDLDKQAQRVFALKNMLRPEPARTVPVQRAITLLRERANIYINDKSGSRANQEVASELLLAAASFERALQIPKLTLVYLASAYSFDQDEGYATALDATTRLHNTGIHVVSPILHNHPIQNSDGGLPDGWEFWARFDTNLLDHCDELWVVEDPAGHWRRSKGVQAEIAHAQKTGKPVRYLPYPFPGGDPTPTNAPTT